MKTLLDNEDAQIQYFQDTLFLPPKYFGNKIKCKKILETIFDKKEWSEWTNSSKESDPPPDFYNKNKEIMMEVMKIDDHTHKNKDGKTINLTAQKERKRFLEIKDKYQGKMLEDAIVLLNETTGLPAKEDHQFAWYKEHFEYVVNKHAKKVNLYKENHPGYKLMFFIFDESSAYVQSVNRNDAEKNHAYGEFLCGMPHFAFWDIDFIKTIKSSGADYVLWFTPYKKIDAEKGPCLLQQLAVYDIKRLSIKSWKWIKYNAEYMVGAEL